MQIRAWRLIRIFVLSDITALVVNYRTLDLTRVCVASFREHYPEVNLLLLDNYSNDPSSEYIRQLGENNTNITTILNPHNRFHGPALDQGIRACKTRLVLLLDSDTEVNHGGFLEQMAELFRDPNLYAAGKVIWLDWFGYEVEGPGRLRFQYVRPCCLLVDREKYLKLKPFIHHGSPGIKNMKHAQRLGYSFFDFPIYDYIHHKGRGTCSRYGYGLGIQHTTQYLLRSFLQRIGGGI